MLLTEEDANDSGQTENENCLVCGCSSVGLSSLKAKRCRGTITPRISLIEAAFPLTHRPPSQTNRFNPFKMPPKKKVERAATENISLGPQVREGELYICPSFQNANKPLR